MNVKRFFRLAALLLMLVPLAACAGGSGETVCTIRLTQHTHDSPKMCIRDSLRGMGNYIDCSFTKLSALDYGTKKDVYKRQARYSALSALSYSSWNVVPQSGEQATPILHDSLHIVSSGSRPSSARIDVYKRQAQPRLRALRHRRRQHL